MNQNSKDMNNKHLFFFFVGIIVFFVGVVLGICEYIENWKYVLTTLGKIAVYWKSTLLIVVGLFIIFITKDKA